MGSIPIQTAWTVSSMVEHLAHNETVVGSSPALSTLSGRSMVGCVSDIHGDDSSNLSLTTLGKHVPRLARLLCKQTVKDSISFFSTIIWQYQILFVCLSYDKSKFVLFLTVKSLSRLRE